jgi:hypothetical protein
VPWGSPFSSLLVTVCIDPCSKSKGCRPSRFHVSREGHARLHHVAHRHLHRHSLRKAPNWHCASRCFITQCCRVASSGSLRTASCLRTTPDLLSLFALQIIVPHVAPLDPRMPIQAATHPRHPRQDGNRVKAATFSPERQKYRD